MSTEEYEQGSYIYFDFNMNAMDGRAAHSSAFQLNVSTFCGG